MSDSITVQTFFPTEICANELFDTANEIARFLLNQSSDFNLELEFNEEFKKASSHIVPNSELYCIDEKKYLGYGIIFNYDLYPYWDEEGDVPFYHFTFMEIARRSNDILLVVCISLAVAVAKILSVKTLIEYNGVWAKNGESMNIDEVLSLGNEESLPIDEALRTFYKKLPAFRRV